MKTYQLFNFHRHRATKPFVCHDCGETIEPGQHYWRLLSLYKYCDRCYILRLNAHGWGFIAKHGTQPDKFWYMRRTSLETQLKIVQKYDNIERKAGRPKGTTKPGRLW